MHILHELILKIMPDAQLWFLDGKNNEGKIISNPNIGYGLLNLHYTGGKTKAFYQIGMSANTGGISLYIMGIKDKAYLAQTFARQLGKANVSGYCIHFKSLKDLNMTVLEEIIRFGSGPK
ncbi:DUF1801 domain-containing protein [Flavobacterium silvisoli]|uniref:DUF1801 domain-containing protein n=1 Tax=Flavobacterium silvisoli TaxID=2529433 RepID=A0A4Q9Z1W1_9FLAO|nr:DUF1801 domain-containing protein [Flavobacterium silvisoli]TBX70278.1 DUF1801 domain-containing protein [Flavobacterium silvisoli]